MKLCLMVLDAAFRNEIPNEKETIQDDMAIQEMAPMIDSLKIYFRTPQDCPRARGNWVVDIYFKDGRIGPWLLPKEMTKEHVKKYMKPLIDLLENLKNERRN